MKMLKLAKILTSPLAFVPTFETQSYPRYLPTNAQTDNAKSATQAAETRYLYLSGQDFRPASSEVYFDFTGMGTDCCGIYPTAGAGLFTAKLSLPEGTRITECEFYCLRTTPGTDSFYLYNTNPLIEGSGYLTSNQPHPTSTQVRTITLKVGELPWLTDKAGDSLYLGWIPDRGRPILFGVRVTYKEKATNSGTN